MSATRKRSIHVLNEHDEYSHHHISDDENDDYLSDTIAMEPLVYNSDEDQSAETNDNAAEVNGNEDEDQNNDVPGIVNCCRLIICVRNFNNILIHLNFIHVGKKKRKVWVKVGECTDMDEAKRQFLPENAWSNTSKKPHKYSETYMYRCNKVAKVGEQCACEMKVKKDKTKPRVEIFASGAHTHDAIRNKVNDKTKDTIIGYRKRGIQPAVIADLLAISHDQPPSKKRVQNIIKRHNTTTGNVTNPPMCVVFDSLKNLLRDPNDVEDDEAYITDFFVSKAVNEMDPRREKPEQSVRFFCTTKRLLQNIKVNPKLVCSDTTYKLNREAVPL